MACRGCKVLPASSCFKQNGEASPPPTHPAARRVVIAVRKSGRITHVRLCAYGRTAEGNSRDGAFMAASSGATAVLGIFKYSGALMPARRVWLLFVSAAGDCLLSGIDLT